MTPVMPMPGEHHLGEDLDRVLGLLGHVDRVLEADHREERQRGRGRHREEGALVAGAVEDHGAGEVGLAREERVEADEDDEQQAGELDAG